MVPTRPAEARTRNETHTPEIRTAVMNWPLGNAGPAKVNSYSPSVTKLVARQAEMIESRTDQPRTKPVALRRNSVGVSPPIASVAMLISRLGAFWGVAGPAYCSGTDKPAG